MQVSKKIYMGGICGMGMAPLAMLLKADGNEVLGFDDNADLRVKGMLEYLGIKCEESIDENTSSDLFVISSALAKRHFKTEKNIQRRGECFADFCAGRKLIAITGSHGKSTVSNMCADVLNSSGNHNAGWMVGAIPNGFLPYRHCANGEYIFSEIDESDGTIENFNPEICCALNCDLDHTDRYADEASLIKMFERLFSRTKKKIIIPEFDKKLVDIATKSGKTFEVVSCDKSNFMNVNKAMANAILKSAFGESFDTSKLDSFCGTVRRQEVLLKNDNIIALADYAHHPNEVRAFLKWLEINFREPICVFFQPHRYTRTKRFAGDFKNILQSFNSGSNKVYVLPVYAASEEFDSEGESLKITKDSSLQLIGFKNLKETIKSGLSKHEKLCLAFVGAGDIYFKAKEILNENS